MNTLNHISVVIHIHIKSLKKTTEEKQTSAIPTTDKNRRKSIIPSSY
jgi:hypothetical protein